MIKRTILWFLRKTNTVSVARNVHSRALSLLAAVTSAIGRAIFLVRTPRRFRNDPDFIQVWHNGRWLLARPSPFFRVIDVANANLALVAQLLEKAGITYFQIEISSVNRYRLAVPLRDRRKIWKLLTSQSDPSLYVYTETRSRHRVHRVGMSRGRTSPPRSMIWRVYKPISDGGGTFVLGDLQGCEIEFWEDSEDGKSLVAYSWNSTAERVRRNDLGESQGEIGGRRYPTIKRHSALPSFDQVTFPVDLVYTWVDGSDPDWIARKNSVLSELGRDLLSVDADMTSRFQSREELRYSLRSVAYFGEFVRKIFIVTDRQVPGWLNLDHPQIEMVDHVEIFGDAGTLPTFNSHAIEARLHHIPGLAEHYVYMNDDFFFGRRLRADTFFNANGLAKMFLSTAHMPMTAASRQALGVDNGAQNGRSLMELHFGVTMGRKFKHAPYPQRRSVLMQMEAAFADELKQTASHQLRHPEDVATASSVSHYYAYVTGAAMPGKITSRYVGLDDPSLEARLTGLLRSRNFDTLCLNDAEIEPAALHKADRLVEQFLKSYFPMPSDYEL